MFLWITVDIGSLKESSLVLGPQLISIVRGSLILILCFAVSIESLMELSLDRLRKSNLVFVVHS